MQHLPTLISLAQSCRNLTLLDSVEQDMMAILEGWTVSAGLFMLVH